MVVPLSNRSKLQSPIHRSICLQCSYYCYCSVTSKLCQLSAMKKLLSRFHRSKTPDPASSVLTSGPSNVHVTSEHKHVFKTKKVDISEGSVSAARPGSCDLGLLSETTSNLSVLTGRSHQEVSPSTGGLVSEALDSLSSAAETRSVTPLIDRSTVLNRSLSQHASQPPVSINILGRRRQDGLKQSASYVPLYTSPLVRGSAECGLAGDINCRGSCVMIRASLSFHELCGLTPFVRYT